MKVFYIPLSSTCKTPTSRQEVGVGGEGDIIIQKGLSIDDKVKGGRRERKLRRGTERKQATAAKRNSAPGPVVQ